MNNMFKKWAGVVAVGAVLGAGSANADGFSATFEVPVLPAFGVGASLNYSVGIVDNVVAGVSLAPTLSFAGGNAVLTTNLHGGLMYANNFYKSGNATADVYAGLGADALFSIVPSAGFLAWSVGAEVGVQGALALSPMVKLLGGADLSGGYTDVIGVGAGANFGIGANIGLKFDIARDFDLRTVFGARYQFLNGGAFAYDARLALAYAVAPEFKIGFYTGFNGGFYIGVNGQYTEKPGTIGTPGSYLP